MTGLPDRFEADRVICETIGNLPWRADRDAVFEQPEADPPGIARDGWAVACGLAPDADEKATFIAAAANRWPAAIDALAVAVEALEKIACNGAAHLTVYGWDCCTAHNALAKIRGEA